MPYRSASKLEAFHLFKSHSGILGTFVSTKFSGCTKGKTNVYLLHKRVTFTAPGHRVPVQINKFQFPEGFKDLLDI
jgi:hypothetical protein